MAISGVKNRLLFVAFFNPYAMIGTDKVQLSELICLAQLV